MSPWSGRAVLVSGGAGFIGKHLASRLVELGATVRIADNYSRVGFETLPEPLEDVEQLNKDLLDPAQCAKACEGVDTVFHMASRVGPSSYYVEHPYEVLSRNLGIDSNILQAAIDAGVRRYFYPSSVFVYPAARQTSPDAPPLQEDEAIPAGPPVSYGWAKIIGETLVQSAVTEVGNFRAAIGRLIGVYGPGQDTDPRRASIIPALTRRAVEYPAGSPFSIRGRGLETRSYCYISDVVDAIVASVDKLDDALLVGPVNLGSEGRITIRELAEQIIAVSGKKIEVHTSDDEPSVWGQSVDCSLARQLFDGWEPKVTLNVGLQKTFEFVAAQMEQSAGQSLGKRKNVHW